MAERMAAAIEIGGPIPARLVSELIARVQAEGLVVGWEEVPFRPTTAPELLDLTGDGDAPGTLLLVDREATWGQFEALEAFLVQHGIAFDRRTEAKYEYDAEIVQFRPGMPAPCRRTTNQAHEPVVAVSSLEPVRQALQKGHVRRACKLLKERMGPTTPAVEPLRIATDTAGVRRHHRRSR